MISDTERREVARRLRELADYCDENEMSLSDYDWPGILSDYIWPEDRGYHIYDDDCRRLADLIEPDCDREALLALASGLEADADRILKAAKSAQFGGGPRMGEAKHDAYEWRSIARRIREACGVVDAG